MKKSAAVILVILLGSCSLQPITPPVQKMLFAVSNARFYGESDIRTSNHFAEIIYAYDVFDKAGYAIDFVSPKGGAVPIGYINSDSMMIDYLYDEDFMNLLEHTKKAGEINPNEYTGIFYSGGGAAMFGVPLEESIQKIARDIYEQNEGIVSAVCHGTAGIANIKKSDGTYLVAGKRITGFPDLFEDKERAYFQEFPFSIEEQVNANGGTFHYSSEGWDGYTEIDGRVITGQDPTSSALVAHAVIEALKKSSIN